MKKCAVDGLPTLVGSLQASLDGVPLKDLTRYRVTSQPFDVYFPPNNVWGSQHTGETRSAADTLIIFLKPLPEGSHVFEFKASSPINPLSPTSAHALEVKYNLLVGK